MSPPGRPKGEYRSAQREGTPVSAPGEAKAGTARRRAIARGRRDAAALRGWRMEAA